MKLDKNAEYILNRLNENGFSAYAVGGVVRDHFLKRQTDDTDIATSALPEETESVFSDITVIKTGIKHGTVTLPINGVNYEVTTFRSEFGYNDKRHPDNVAFVKDIKEDLSRRDFTVNAIAYSPKEGFIDPFGGTDDIDKKSSARSATLLKDFRRTL